MLHQPQFLRQSLAVAVSLFSWQVAMAASEAPLAPPAMSTLVITAPAMSDPYTVRTDTRQPRLPLPAQDGGAFLKSIPGFSVSRKGGTSGDPELRGLGGSRLAIQADGASILGGCGGRMDPPTAYIFPQAYDRVEIIKGPQSVRYGVAPAGVVRFERDKPVLTEATVEGFASSTLGSHDRFDLVSDLTAGSREGYVRLIGTLSDQDDYRDGDGNQVHSQYSRWSGTAILGWTPDVDTRIELAVDRSDAEAAYDDRRMDGTEFDRTGYTLSVTRQNLAPWLTEVEAMAYYNYVDHVMDNFRLREAPMMAMASNPDRRTQGARLSAELALGEASHLATGLDYTENRHRWRGTTSWREQPRSGRAEFTDLGAFAELEHELGARSWLTVGLRVDRAEAEALNPAGFGGADRGDAQRSTLWSGFARYEHALADRPVSLFAGVGRAERAGDFWERNRVFGLGTETLTQLDSGASWNGERLTANLSLFYGWYDDYILVDETGNAPRARNIDATTLGAEADLRLRVTDSWSLSSSLAWVRSNNDTDDRPLAQTPPLEATLGLDYAQNAYFGGVLWRGVMRQDRIAEGQGTIYSLDTDELPGFATASVYAGRKLFGNTTVTLGVDNLFDRAYAEHIQRGSADLGATDARVNEPGRTLWANLTTRF
ncbi:TonB-dependent copper receptor [Halomonas campisalis]|uniref:TonB-dependent copper receptor n=1 Tax=Billgrantia campisalis TaxID=74661 RepID=A0ABS9P500_9GAMM|nr:TonB-dependent copper receptor [Halomonas campisalis]MCG6656839.1 TonB-dependent copper receptor [Halomonas campisalis]MDR5862028.1 TonB-dependent copper receptor [Halomonas campisalis]